MIRHSADPVRDTAGLVTVDYGNVPAVARFQSDGRMSVDLLRDPGTGAMSFHRLSPTVLTVTGGDPAVIRRVAAAYAEGVRYVTPGGPGAVRMSAEHARLIRLADELDPVTP